MALVGLVAQGVCETKSLMHDDVSADQVVGIQASLGPRDPAPATSIVMQGCIDCHSKPNTICRDADEKCDVGKMVAPLTVRSCKPGMTVSAW